MRGFCLLLFSCTIISYCFAQTTINIDSVAIIKNNPPLKNIVAADSVKTTLFIYPNPATNKITLQVTGFKPGMINVKITDIKGKIWREDKRLLTNGSEELTMFLMLPSGIYFVSLAEKKKSAKRKLVIM